jgi:hypothetical protein
LIVVTNNYGQCTFKIKPIENSSADLLSE